MVVFPSIDLELFKLIVLHYLLQNDVLYLLSNLLWMIIEVLLEDGLVLVELVDCELSFEGLKVEMVGFFQLLIELLYQLCCFREYLVVLHVIDLQLEVESAFRAFLELQDFLFSKLLADYLLAEGKIFVFIELEAELKVFGSFIRQIV